MLAEKRAETSVDYLADQLERWTVVETVDMSAARTAELTAGTRVAPLAVMRVVTSVARLVG